MVTWIKRFLVLFPMFLLVLSVASFLVVKNGSRKRVNQLSIGSGAEAENLNPIIATTTTASEVTDLVFNGLVKYDENLDLTGDLAKDWSITQDSTIFFKSPDLASAAIRKLDAARSQWAAWKLSSAEASGERLILHLNEAGASIPEKIQALFEKSSMKMVSVVRIDTKEQKVSFTVGENIAEVWQDGTLGWELAVIGDPQPLLEDLRKRFPQPTKDSFVTPSVVQTADRLDEPEILFHLRPGVRWHDGQPFTAGDVEFTYRMLMSEEIASPRRSDYELIKKVEVIDPLTVKVVYRRLFSPCLSSWGTAILPKHLLDEKPSAWWAENYNRKPVGTGPFKFVEWKVNNYVRLVKNEDYFEGPPHLDAVVLRTIPDPVSIRLSFETREIDYWSVEPFAVEKFKHDFRFDVYSRLSPSYNYIGWNLNRDLFEDVRVRQALAQAVDVQKIIQFIYYGNAEQSRGIFPPMMWFANPNIRAFEYNPKNAEHLLDEAGWKKGPDGVRAKDGKPFAFKLITNNNNEERKDIATLVQNDFKKIGIQVDVLMYEWAVFITKFVNKMDFDAVVLGWSLGYDHDQYQIWSSTQAKPERLNFVSYKNSQVDHLLDQARSEFDREKIKAACWELQKLIYGDQPYLFIDVPDAMAVMWKNTFQVRRPDGKGGWITEPIRETKAGFRYYMIWWERTDLGNRS